MEITKISELQDKPKKYKKKPIIIIASEVFEKEMKELENLKEQLKKETDKSEWLKIPELKIEIQIEIHHKNQTYTNCEKDLNTGESIPTYEQIQWLRNSKYKNQLNLDDTYEFVQNPDNISKENGYVARFYAYSDCACLSCDWGSSGSGSVLGVRFVRKLKVEKLR